MGEQDLHHVELAAVDSEAQQPGAVAEELDAAPPVEEARLGLVGAAKVDAGGGQLGDERLGDAGGPRVGDPVGQDFEDLAVVPVLALLEVARGEGLAEAALGAELGDIGSAALHEILGHLVIGGCLERRGQERRTGERRGGRRQDDAPLLRELDDAPLAVVGGPRGHGGSRLDERGERLQPQLEVSSGRAGEP